MKETSERAINDDRHLRAAPPPTPRLAHLRLDRGSDPRDRPRHLAVVGSITPWPSAMLIRAVFTKGGDATAAEMKRHAPTHRRHDTRHPLRRRRRPTRFDVFTVAEEGGMLPTIVWIHGGAWISGSYENVDPYLRILASEGYTTVALNYGLGPEAPYPYGGDPAQRRPRVPERARRRTGRRPHASSSRETPPAPSSPASSRRHDERRYAAPRWSRTSAAAPTAHRLILNCGVYDMRAMAELDGLVAWGLKSRSGPTRDEIVGGSYEGARCRPSTS